MSRFSLIVLLLTPALWWDIPVHGQNQVPGSEQSPASSSATDNSREGGEPAAPVKAKTFSEEERKEVEKEREARLSYFSAMSDLVKTRGPIALLENPAIQNELGLSKKQVGKIRQIQLARHLQQGAQHETTRQAIPKGIGPKTDWSGAEMQAVSQVLTRIQFQRLRQLTFQARGPLLNLTDPEIMAYLNIAPEQIVMIQENIKRTSIRKMRQTQEYERRVKKLNNKEFEDFIRDGGGASTWHKTPPSILNAHA